MRWIVSLSQEIAGRDPAPWDLRSRDVFPWRDTFGGFVRGEWPGPVRAPESAEAWLAAVAGAEGSFSVVSRVAEDEWIAATDARRSFPLFWTWRDGRVVVTDDARRAREIGGGGALDPVAVAEARCGGFVLGHRTLDPDVFALRAGEALRVRDGERGSEVRVISTADLGRTQPVDTGVSRLDRLDALDVRMQRMAARTFESLGGRRAVIPLTGGHDSRLLAILARRLGYENVVCVATRQARHWETTIAREVAERLGFPLLHFGAQPARWVEWYRSEERRRYCREADGLSSAPWLLECLALSDLRSSRVIGAPDRAVILPGHFAGLVARDVPVDGPGGDPEKDAVQNVIWRRYCLNPWPRRGGVAEELRSRVRESVREFLPADGEADERLRRALQAWEWREYSTKRVGAAVRAYEFFGFEWRLPFLDRELREFWSTATREERHERDLYQDYVRRAGLPWRLPLPNPGVVPVSRRRPRRWARRFGVLGAARWARRWMRRWDGQGIRRGDGVGWDEVIPGSVVRRTYTGMEGVESYLVRDWLEEVGA
ncbi:MAG: asparagine synthase C-terminal domain-containing protein [bacterium]